MLKDLSIDALKQASTVLHEGVHVSHLETLLRAFLPHVRELVDNEIKARDGEAKNDAAPAAQKPAK